MKILSPEQIKRVDTLTIHHKPISSLALMEKAATACVDYIIQQFSTKYTLYIFCGNGNNGGDGLAIARLLTNQAYSVEVFIWEASSEASLEFTENRRRYEGPTNYIQTGSDISLNLAHNSIVIDALLGNGLNKPVDGELKSIIEKLNSLKCYKISIDIPSGLFADRAVLPMQTVFEAHTTLCFEVPKLNFMFRENEPYVGAFEILSIGWLKEEVQKCESNYHFTTMDEIMEIYTPRKKFSTKHDFGHALLIAGAQGMIGAAVLSTNACLKSGAGLTTINVPGVGFSVLQTQAPEAICIADSEPNHITTLPNLSRYTSVGIGQGLGMNPATQKVLSQLIEKSTIPIVLDADALNILAEQKHLLTRIKPNTILTPHDKEFARLFGTPQNDAQRIQIGIEYAKKFQLVLVLKGAHTAVINADGNVYFNSTGNTALAKGGNGDVLTGIIASLLAQHYTPIQAAILGVFVHGLAADYCIEKMGIESVLASNVIDSIGDVFKSLNINSRHYFSKKEKPKVHERVIL